MSVLDRAIVKAYERRRLTATGEPAAGGVRCATDIEATLAEVDSLTSAPALVNRDSSVQLALTATDQAEIAAADASVPTDDASTQLLEPLFAEAIDVGPAPTISAGSDAETIAAEIVLPPTELNPSELNTALNTASASAPEVWVEPETAGQTSFDSEVADPAATDLGPPETAEIETAAAAATDPEGIETEAQATEAGSTDFVDADLQTSETVAAVPIAAEKLSLQRPTETLQTPATAIPRGAPVADAVYITKPQSASAAYPLSKSLPSAPVPVPATVPTTVPEVPAVRKPWVWPEICEQLDQFTGDGFRQLAKHLQFAAVQGQKVLAFVSSKPGVGRTSVLLTLSRILALEGRTAILLIDADRRHPDLAKLGGQPPKAGLSEVLHGQATARQAIINGTPGNISLLPLLKPQSEGEWSTLTTSMRAFVKQVRDDHDMVLIDAGVFGSETKLADCWLRGAADAVITISRQLSGKNTAHEVLNWKQIGIESLGVIETFS